MGIAGTLLAAMVFATTAPGSSEGDTVRRSMDAAEFVALHRLSDAALRARFRLPLSCNPSLSAVRRATERFEVTIVCDDDGLREPATSAPTSRPRSGGERRR